MILTDQLEKFR